MKRQYDRSVSGDRTTAGPITRTPEREETRKLPRTGVQGGANCHPVRSKCRKLTPDPIACPIASPILPPSFRLNTMELLLAMLLKCPCRFGGTGPLSFPSLRSLCSLWPKFKRAGLQTHVNATDLSAGRGAICHKERRERRDLEGRDRLPRSTHPPERRKNGRGVLLEIHHPLPQQSVLRIEGRVLSSRRQMSTFGVRTDLKSGR